MYTQRLQETLQPLSYTRNLQPYKAKKPTPTTLITHSRHHIQLNTLNKQISALISNHKANKFKEYLQNNLTNSNDKRTWQVIKRLHNSQNNPPTLNEALKENNNTLPSPKQNCNILAQHYSN